jgi:DNA-binding CsgD family transcriptional regulator
MNGHSLGLCAGAFVFCERDSGTVRFQVEASSSGGLAVEQAASMLAMHCLVRGQTPGDYTILVQPRGAVLESVEQRAGELLKAGREIRRDFELTARERDVLHFVVQSLSNKEIAARLNLAERTVKFHVSSLLAKFKVSDRFSLVRRAMIGVKPPTADATALADFNVVGIEDIAEQRTGPVFTANGRELPVGTSTTIATLSRNGNGKARKHGSTLSRVS